MKFIPAFFVWKPTLRVYLWDSIQSDSQVRADSKMYLDNCCDLIYEEGFCLFATWRGRQRRNRVFASCERRQYLTQPVLLRQPTEFSLCELDPSRAFASFVSPSTLFSSKAMFPKICWPTVSQFCSVTVLCFGWCNSNIWPDSQKWISPTDRLKKQNSFSIKTPCGKFWIQQYHNVSARWINTWSVHTV